MQDYAKQLLSAINQYDADNPESVNHLRDLVCWISDNDALKKDKVLAQLLYIASQKMRVFGYNMLNGYSEDPNEALATLEDISNRAIKNLYRSRVNEKNTLDKSQMEVVDLFQSLSPRRLLVSAPTSYGKTFLMREIVFLNKDRYNNILLVFPTVALLLENARMMSAFVSDNNLDYQIIKTVDSVVEDESKKIFVFTPERALQLIASFPDLKIDFFFFDEVYNRFGLAPARKYCWKRFNYRVEKFYKKCANILTANTFLDSAMANYFFGERRYIHRNVLYSARRVNNRFYGTINMVFIF